MQINLRSTLQARAIRLEGPVRCTIVSLYLPSGHTTPEEELNNLFKELESPNLIIGDFNGHHVSWGNSKDNNRGRAIARLVEEHNAIVLNDGRPTWIRHNPKQQSAIDLSVCSWGLAASLRWDISSDTWGSDHFPITINTNTVQPTVTRRPRWKYQEANWEGFEDDILELIQRDHDLSIEDIMVKIETAALRNIPKTSGTTGTRAVPWWNNTVKAAIKARRKALRRLRRLDANDVRREEALRQFQIARQISRKAVFNAKRCSWEEFIDGISPSSSTTEV